MSQPSRSPKAGPRPGPANVSRLSGLIAAVLAAACLASPALASAAPIVVIDAGHGGIYNHARAGRLREKDVNLWMSLELASMLSARGYRVGMTRTDDRTVMVDDIPTWNWDGGRGLWSYGRDGVQFGDPPLDDLQARVNVANAAGADLFVSIHNNGARSRRARGTETWVAPSDPQGLALARQVQRAVVQSTRLRNRGTFQTGFYVLRWSNMPAVLVEGAFMSNRAEGRKLGSAFFRRNLARGIATGIDRWLQSNPFWRIFPRISGGDAARTAVAASAAGWPTGAETVLLAPAADLSRALACAPLSREASAPLLYADAAGAPAATLAELARLRPRRLVVLGTAAALPDAVVASAASAAGATVIERIAGADAPEAAATIAGRVWPSFASTTTVLACADSYADTLAAASLAAARRYPLVLTAPGATLSPSAAAFLAAHAAETSRTIVVDGSGAIADSALAGLPSVVRVSGEDRFQTNARALRLAYPAPEPVAPFVVAPSGPDALTAVVAAAHAPGGVVLFNGGRVLSPWTREWLSNMRGRLTRITIVGDDATQPPIVDWMVDKAIH